MNDFREALARFRDTARREGEQTGNPGLRAILERDRARTRLRLRWAVAAAMALAMVAIPVYKNAARESALEREAEQEKADAVLLKQVNAGLSRSAPRAMAPLMGGLPVNTEIQGETR